MSHLKLSIKDFVKRSLVTEPAIFVIAIAISAYIKWNCLKGDEGKSGKARCLILSYGRWSQDIDAILATNRVLLFLLPDRFVEFFNSLFFLGTERETAEKFWEEPSGSLRFARTCQELGWRSLLEQLNQLLQLDAILTCNYRYLREVPIAKASKRVGLPFIAWHKEFTILDPRDYAIRITNTKKKGHKFFGTLLCCVTDSAKNFFVDAGVFLEPQIKTVGLLRIDNLINSKQEGALEGRPTVCLFSFGHLTGRFEGNLDTRNYYFSANGDFGFVRLFEDTHRVFAELAIECPGVDFLIKPKNFEKGWVNEIKAVIDGVLSKPFDEISNLRIVNENAQSLMKRSKANVVFNSTTVIESAICCSQTIVPIFAEALDVHKNAVYLTEYSGAFKQANSPSELKSMLRAAIDCRGENKKDVSQDVLKNMLNRQVGNSDGKSAHRFIDVVESASSR